MRPVLAAILVVAATACGSGSGAETPPPDPLPAKALPELSSSVRTLDRAALATDALAPAQLETLLDEAGYVTGREREFSGKTKMFDHVVARTLRFDDEEGAEQYLRWLRAHGTDFLGRAAPAPPPVRADSAVAFVLVRCGTCKKELPTFLAGWRDGPLVASLLAAGPGVNKESFAALAREVDAAVR
jgi:hypothetical protein